MGQGGGQGGGEMGGGTREQCGSNKVSLKNLTIGLLAGDEGGEAWGGWAREAGKGAEMGGGESSVGARRRALVPPFGLP